MRIVPRQVADWLLVGAVLWGLVGLMWLTCWLVGP